jgi:hypothetical protein
VNSDFVDFERSSCLCTEGLPGYIAAVAVGEDGSETLLLVAADQIGDVEATYDPQVLDAGHEQLGRLPAGWHERVWSRP